jgi:low affinity Fe/Cu permease
MNALRGQSGTNFAPPRSNSGRDVRTQSETSPMANTKGGKPSANGNGSASNRQWFDSLARSAASLCGKPTSFLIATAIVLIWAVSGPVFHWSDTWQLVINTGTTIVTFLMVFLIQSTQNRDALAIQVKLSELILALKGADNQIASIEHLSEEELEQIRRRKHEQAAPATARPKQRRAGKHDEDGAGTAMSNGN